jgi:hypothetical protein
MNVNHNTLINCGHITQYGGRSKGGTLQKVIEK